MIRRSQLHGSRRGRGFSLLELVIVIAIAMIVVAMAVPGTRRLLQNYNMRSSVTSLTGAIQSARYNAIFHGCKYQLVFSGSSYTVASQVPAAGSSTCLAAYSAASTAIPLQGRGVNLTATTTMQFLPNGQIQTVPAASPMSLQLTYPGSGLTDHSITVSPYGKITVYP